MRVMGVDLGVHKIAYALWEDGVLLETDAYNTNASTRQEQLLHVSDYIYEVVHNTQPDMVFIEDVLIGNNRKYSMQLAETKGAVLANLGLLEMEQALTTMMVNVGTWKKETIGNGKASKDAIRDYLYSLDSAYSVLCGYDQDRFDAACIGYYGVVLDARTNALMEAIGRAPSNDRPTAARKG